MKSGMFPRAAVLALALLACASARAAEPDASDWSAGQNSSARLISVGSLAAGAYLAGVEIKLERNSLTYWRNPGDAGVPPVFSFAGSDNLGSASVAYPAPGRIVEAGSDVFGYRGGVIFPVTVTPKDPAKPVELVLHLQYAACDKICIPAEARARLRFAPGVAESPHKARIEAFVARTPKPMDAPGAPTLKLTRQVAANPTWIVSIAPAPGVRADLFPDAPDGWFFETKRDGDGFLLVLAQKPADADAHAAEVSLTYAGETGAFETKLRLDAGPATP